ncbi:right-handed parallel beta-helix repeat-containing protein [Candidatus Woesearchaeota archaeon]|nr:right-handed parallel beta-helix repeat-containing protein [Candidatus Woesearchaeota archaeon]
MLIGNTSGTGIYTGKTNTTVLGCDVRDFYHGAYLWRGNHSRISDFYAEGNSYAGLTLHNSSFVNITDATVTDNSNAGIFLTTYSGNNNLSGIDAYDNYIGIYSYYSHNNTMKDIECYDNTWYGLDLERSDDNDLIDIMHHNNLKGLYLSYSHRNDLVNISSFNNSGSGILLWFSETNHLRNVSSSNNDESGLVIWTARNNLVENMTIDSNGVHGIYSYMSLRARIFNNTLTGNSLSGICINRSDSNVLKDNNITGNYRGVCASGSYGTVIEQNDIIGSTTSGVFGGPDGTLAILNNTISGGTGCGVNVSGADINLTANTISSNSLDGVWVQDADLANISSNSVSGNGGFGLFYINSTFLPSAPLSANTVSTDNTFGMLSFNWYVEIRTFDRTGSDQANASVNVTVVGDAAPQHVTVTDAGFTTPRLIMTEYMIDNSVSRVNRSYTIYAVYGGFAGTNSSNVTQHLLDADGNAVTVTLSTALPPSVTLVSPAHNTSTTDHNPVFVCNASHEGGLANITLYHSNSGNWTAVKTNNVSGIANQTSFTVPVSDGSFNWSCLAKGLFENSGFGSNFTLRVYTVVTDTGGTGGGGDTPPPDEPPPEPPPPEPPPPEPPPPEPPPDEPPPEPPGEPETETPAESAAPAEGSAESDKEALEVVDIAEAVSCEEKIVIKEEDISLDELKNLIELPPGYIIVGKPFKADCAGGETFSTSLLLPDNLEDVQVIQCAVGSCASKTTRYVNRMCPGEEVELVREEDEFDMSSMTVNMTPVASKLSAGNRSLKSGDYEVDVGGEEDVEVSMGVAAGVQKEPANRNVRIVGAPVELKVAGVTDSVEVTLPFSVGEGEDASSVAVYAKRIEGNTTRWLYIGGQIDLVKRVVEAKVNLSQYAETGSVTLAPITIHCPECGGEADFRNVFTPARDSRQAIILLHGLWGVGKVWDSMVDEFRLTRQPYQLWTYSYLVSNPLERSGLDLANYLEANSYRYDSIYIVGYSLGGLVAQSALRQAYDMREQGIADYSFLDDVRKVLLVANPSEGSPVADYADIFLTESVNSEDSAVLPMNSIVKDVLSEGYVSEPVPGMSYYAIAGTKSYGFMDRLGLTERLFEGQPNDGVVAVRSAQRLGNNYLDRDCVNYWSQPVDHTHLIEDRLVQKIMGQIISRDLFEAAGEEDQKVSLFGYSNYYEVEIEDCSPDRLYFVIGVEKEEEKVERVAYCACGNGVCDGLENAKTCPDDCRLVAKPLVTRIVEHSLEILALLIALFMVFGFFFAIYEHYKKKKKKEEQLPPGFNILEGKSMPAERLTYVRTGLVGLGKRMVMFIRLPHIMLRKTGEGNGWSESHRESAAEKKERKRREVLRSKIRLHTERIKMRLAGSRSKGSRKSVKGTPKKKGRHKAGKKKSRTHEPGKNRAAKHKAVKHRPRKSAPKKHKVRQQRPGHSKQKHGTGKPKKQNTHRTGAGNFQKPYK